MADRTPVLTMEFVTEIECPGCLGRLDVSIEISPVPDKGSYKARYFFINRGLELAKYKFESTGLVRCEHCGILIRWRPMLMFRADEVQKVEELADAQRCKG